MRVWESDGATAQAVCRPWVTGYTDTCSHLGEGGGHDRFCHREQVLGLCRCRRTVCAEVGNRWRDGAASLLTMGFNHTDACTTCWHGKLTCPILDCLETVMGLCRLPRTVCESVGQRWCDGAGRLPILGYPVTKMLAHTLVWAVDAADFRLSRNDDGAVPAAAHSLRACGRAMLIVAYWRPLSLIGSH